MSDQEIENFVKEAFEQNYELLRMEGGHALAPDVKEAALLQVMLYWRKLRSVAESVTDTEVKLNLPGQKTVKGRRFAIEGIVDIVREKDATTMYDIKTHDIDVVRANRTVYERQLNLYAHIWQNLRGQELDGMAIIATAFPESLKESLASGDNTRADAELAKWNPLIEVPVEAKSVTETVTAFAATVDKIEDKAFSPPSVQALRMSLGDGRTLFATRVCRNCDARFSCDSYREYALGSRQTAEAQFRKYFAEVAPDLDREQWLTASLQAAPPEATLS